MPEVLASVPENVPPAPPPPTVSVMPPPPAMLSTVPAPLSPPTVALLPFRSTSEPAATERLLLVPRAEALPAPACSVPPLTTVPPV